MEVLPTTPLPEDPVLPASERERIRAEVRYAAMVTREVMAEGYKPKTGMDRILGYLSNGFVLLLAGSIVTSFLVPNFQRWQEARAKQAALMTDCYAQFLAYSNSIWQEYYSILPVTQEPRLTKPEYLKQVGLLTEIKLRRYDAFAKAQSLALSFRPDRASQRSVVERELDAYAVEVNAASAKVDAWLTGMYCTPKEGEDSTCANFDPSFNSFSAFKDVQRAVVQIGNKRTDEVASRIVDAIRSQ